MRGDGNTGLIVASARHVGGTRDSGIVSSADDVRGMRGVGGVCEMCMCLALAAWEERAGVSGREDWVWALPIIWEQGECWTCVCQA